MLPKLPPEIQRMVVEELRLPHLPLGTPRSLYPDFVESRSALLGLCLTSRHLHALAEPLLYESVALTEDKQFVHLLDALLAKRNRRSWIRSIACPMCIINETDTLKTLPLWNRLIAPRKEADLDRREKQALLLIGLEVDHILEEDRWFDDYGLEETDCAPREDGGEFCDQLLAVLLCLTSRLEDLLLQIPTNRESPEGLENLAHALCLGLSTHQPDVLQSLRCVRVQPTRLVQCKHPRSGSREIRPRNTEPGSCDPGFGIDPLSLRSFEIQTVEEVEYCGDNGIWFKLLKPDHGPWTDDTLPLDLRRFRSLKSLKLHESRTTPSYLRHLLEQAHSLKTFHYTTRQQEWRQDYWCPRYADYSFMPQDFYTINEALEPVKNTVKELALGNVQRPWDNGDEEYRDLELIVVLDSFKRLTHLSIDVRWLIPISLDLDEEVAIVPLCKRLPQSIEDIKLTETWTRKDLGALSSSPRLEKRAMAWIQAALWTLLVIDDKGDGNGKKLAHLRKVTLVAIPAFHPHGARELEPDEEENDEDFDCAPLKTGQGMEEMKSTFGRNHIKFNVEWMCHDLSSSPSLLESGGEDESNMYHY